MSVDHIPHLWMQSLHPSADAHGDAVGLFMQAQWCYDVGQSFSQVMGKILAAQLYSAAESAAGGYSSVRASLEEGDLDRCTAWLNNCVWSKASLHTAERLVELATGSTLSTAPLKQHLISRYIAGL
jgi:Zn-dependent M32 family carboxypeptidase